MLGVHRTSSPAGTAIQNAIKYKILQLEMMARRTAGQRDGRRRQADDDFGRWVKTTVLFSAASGP